MKDLEPYIKQLKNLPVDLKAEVVVADLLEEGVKMDDILVSYSGLFRRKFENDIAKVEAVETQKGIGKKLRIELNRDGLYDNLPEGLFHQPSNEKAASNKQEVVKEMKVQKKREEAVRKFFAPIEQEFFGVRVRLELEERKYLFDANTILDNDLFIKFWNLPKFLTDKQVHNLLYLLPMIYRIVGDWERTRLCFETILEDRIELSFNQPLKYQVEGKRVSLNDFQLGVDSVIGEQYRDIFNSVVIKISPSSPEKIPSYFPNASGEKVIYFLGNYLFPVETDFRTTLDIAPEYRLFSLTEEVFSSRLNYTTYL